MGVNQEQMATDEEMSKKKREALALILLVITTIFWGSTFIITKTVTEDVPPFFYLGLRFLIALLGFLPYFIYLKNLTKKVVSMGIISGLIYFVAITTQTLGLQTTTAGKAGFITGLNTVMVPFLAFLMYKQSFKKRIWLAAILSIIGMAFLFLEGGEGKVVIGDILVLICAVFCALFIIYNNKAVRLVNVYLYSIIQLVTITCCCFSFSLLLMEPYNQISYTLDFWLIMIYMGLIVTTSTFLFQNWAQKYQDSATTAIIFALEPVFAVIFGFLLGDEILTPLGFLGSALILIAIFITVSISYKE
jgi:drug/metabolite transporter (DMT)-like permease